MASNPKGAGRKPLPYKTKPMRVPCYLQDKIKIFIREELKNDNNTTE